MVTEPTTMLTDYAMAIQCVVQALVLWRRGRASGGGNRQERAQLWVFGFAVAALASAAGGTSHGFRVPLGEYWAPVWTLTVWSILCAFALIVVAGIRSSLRPRALSTSTRHVGRLWLLRGFGLTAVGLVVLVSKVSLHQHFNQNDLYHVIQMAGLYGVYRGALLLHGLDDSEARRST